MIVVPNSYERYLASLRIFVSLSILKHGLQQKHMEKLKKIYFAEALLDKKHLQSVNLFLLCINLLCAISALKKSLNFCCEVNGNFYLNKKLFSILLLDICKFTNNINIIAHKNDIHIKFKGKNSRIKQSLNALNGIMFYEKSKKISLIIIPAIKTNEQSVYIESEWELLFDKFSSLNIAFSNILKEK